MPQIPSPGTDIITTVRSNQPVKNGTIICGVDKEGNIQKIDPNAGKNHISNSGWVEGVFTTRWDDTNFYTS